MLGNCGLQTISSLQRLHGRLEFHPTASNLSGDGITSGSSVAFRRTALSRFRSATSIGTPSLFTARHAVLVYCKDTKQIDLILRDGFLGCWNEKRSSTSDLVAFTADTAENQLTLFRKTLWLDWN